MITVTTQQVAATVTGFGCPLKQVKLTAGTVGVFPQQLSTISHALINGVLQVHLETNLGIQLTEGAHITGTLTVEAPGAGTYSTT